VNRIPTRIFWTIATFLCLLPAATLSAQGNMVPLYHQDLVPGMIGQYQNLKGRGIPGYFQPTQIVPPQGTQIAPVIDGVFSDDMPAPATFGCLIGSVYRFRITNIPGHPGRELYPSVEVIDRLYPPEGRELECPIPIHLTQEELNYALEGRFVTRVVYLENPRTAIPHAYEPGFQPYYEVAPEDDPILTADQLGRPVAILRLGSRRPSPDDAHDEFTYQSPPIHVFDPPVNAPAGVAHQPQANPGQRATVPYLTR